MKKNKKKFLLTIVVVAMIFSISACGEIDNNSNVNKKTENEIVNSEEIIKATPMSGECGNNLTYTLDEDGTLTISGNGKMTVYGTGNDGYEKAPWLEQHNSIKKVIVEEGVQEISSHAFYHCSNLKEVSLPTGIPRIRQLTFAYCHALEEISLPDEITTIERMAFAGCRNLKRIYIPESVYSINVDAFESSKELIITGKSGSKAEEFANENNYEFETV